ncbi:peptidoglycan-binding protein [uncultured Dialister sp.]|uniref:peptidoglycan-binding protein n=1 Tax=uncultured Dialister sp. TaxID=278064 RepID=UPI0026096288|nr:peptidoglycan-binding protein [uncultured Dialister sp.]
MRALYTWGYAAAIWLVASLTASAQTLTVGMSGSEVTSLQNDLVAAGYLARTVDGDYGSTTKEAVALFQKAKGLPVTGRADDDTRAAIERAAGAGYRPGGGVVYAEGNRGSMISDMQVRLQAAGYLKGGIDGVYGADTTNAVKAFQKAKGIPVSGAIDEMTYSALRNVDSSSPSYESSGGEEGSSASRGASLYIIGDSGSEVSSIQRKLKKMGYLDGSVDGIYGGDTASAVKAFQDDEGLSSTGMVDGDTLARITSEYAAQSGETVLSPGDSGKKVIRLQNKLLLHGYNPGSVDGVYGEGTAEAVRRLQAEENLARTGIADGDVWDRLDSAPRFTGNYQKVFHMEATAYTPNDGDGRGRTAMGGYAGKGHAAVDPNIIPLGSEVYIEGYGYAICDDIGGAIHGNIIDVGVDNYDQAYKWGLKPKVNVYLIR